MDIGGGGGQGARISHLVSRYVKAEFCVVIGGRGSKGAARGREYVTLSEQICQS